MGEGKEGRGSEGVKRQSKGVRGARGMGRQ